MRRLIFLLSFIICLCAFIPVAFMSDTTYYGYFDIPWRGDGGWYVPDGGEFGPRYAPVEGASTDHPGVDIAGNGSDNGFACASADGIVDWVGYDGTCGYIVIIHHDVPYPDFPNGIYTRYIDISDIMPDFPNVGERISKGTLIGELNAVGKSTGGHLHIEFHPDYGGGCDNDPVMDPARFIAGLPLGSGDSMPAGVPHRVEHSPYGQFQQVLFEFKYGMLNGFRTIFETFAKAIVQALQNIRGIVRNIFIILIMIDLALAAMFKVFEEGEDMIRFVLFKFLFYGIMLLLIDRFSDLANYFVKDWFIAGAGKAMSTSEAEVIRIVSDPMMIIEKGLNVIQPIINEAFSFSWPIGKDLLATLSPDLADMLAPGPGVISLLLLVIGIVIYLILLVFIAFMIALAYLQFYFFILFAFTTMIFAGTKQTRQTRLANRGLTGVFAGAINLMFYCMLSLLLCNCLVYISDQAKLSEPVTTTVSVNLPESDQSGVDLDANAEANAKTVYEDFKAAGYSDEAIAGIMGRLQQEHGFDTSNVEEYDWIDPETGDEYHLGGYGMYQWNGGRTQEFLAWAAENGYDPQDPHTQNAYAIQEAYDRGLTPEYMNSLSATQAAEVWTREWEVGEPGEEIYYADNWRVKISEWNAASGGKTNPASPRNANSPATRKITGRVPSGSKNLIVVIQLNICLLIFVFMAVRMSNLIASLFKGNGFELLNSRND